MLELLKRPVNIVEIVIAFAVLTIFISFYL